MAVRLAKRLVSPQTMEYISLSEEIDITEIILTDKVNNTTVGSLNIRREFGLNIIAIKHKDTIITEITPATELFTNDNLVVIGKRTNIDQLLPPNGFGAKYYVRPRNILLGAERLTFTTTFQEGSDGVQADEWRDHVMIVDLKTGTLLYTQRAEQVDKKLTQWSYDFKPAADAQVASDQILELKVQKQAGSDQLVLLESSLPYSGIEIQLSNNKAVVFVGNRTNDSYQSTPYGKAYYSLAKSNLPSVFRAEELGLPFISGNNLQQRKYVRTVFQVLVDDDYVNGALSWRGKNGKRCLWYEFDHNLDLVDGQIITVKMGMPL
jgi:hypothetical protein